MYAITFSNDVWVTWRCKCCLLRMICISSFFYKNDTIIDTILSSFMVCCNLRLMLCCSMIEHHEPINFSNCKSYAINIDQPSPRMVQKNIKPWKASRSLMQFICTYNLDLCMLMISSKSSHDAVCHEECFSLSQQALSLVVHVLVGFFNCNIPLSCLLHLHRTSLLSTTCSWCLSF